MLPDAGLSPRVRGNHQSRPSLANRSRSIPASAGQPHRDGSHYQKLKVYPRECGATAELH